MADISQITLPDNNVYYIKDATARSTIENLKYAASPSVAGPATRTSAIPFGICDTTSTATAFTATVPGITSLYNGVTMMLQNNVVTSASGFTININGLGAKPVYNNMAAATRDTTIFNVAYTMLFVYDEERVEGGCWICYRGYDANTNTVGYQLRTNSTVMNVSDTARYYKIYFTSADGTKWVPASVNSTNNATSARTVNQRPINPFGRIVYTSASTSYAAGANLAATTLWDQYILTLGYSFNRTGAALTLTTEKPVYIKCAPQTDGSAIIDATTPYVQALPSSDDGKIYIFLGVATSATTIELFVHHPVYYYKNNAIRLWTNALEVPTKISELTNDSGFITDAGVTKITTTAGAHSTVSNATGVVSLKIPTKTSHLTNDSGFITDAGVTSFNGNTGAITYTAPVTSVNGSTGAVTVAVPTAATALPLVDGTAAVGSSAKYAREDHVHPHDTSKQDTLISGTNIKTINNTSILGSGNIPINVTAMTDAEIIAAVQTGWGVTVPQSATGVSF